MKTNAFLKYEIIIVAIIVLVAVGVIGWYYYQNRDIKYTREGYGGFVHVDRNAKAKPQAPIEKAQSAYDSGDYKKAESDALKIVEKAKTSTDPKLKKDSAKARYILAFSSARQKDLKEARVRFAVLKSEASKLPDKGKQEPIPGQAPTTLEEEGAYQHAVCTAALGDKQAGEYEYIQFMKDYPESPLVHGCIQRIAKLHGGHYPPEAEAVWKQAMEISKQREEARQKRAALCGPECMVEYLKRQGVKTDAKTLASEMKTSKDGTSMKAMSDASAKRGVMLKGLRVTPKGLKQQKLPLIALVIPGHYIIIESMDENTVQTWDASGAGISKPARRTIKMKDFEKMWDGVVLGKG